MRLYFDSLYIEQENLYEAIFNIMASISLLRTKAYNLKSLLLKMIMIALFIIPRYFNESVRFLYSIYHMYILVESVNSTVHNNFCLFEYGNLKNVQQKLLPVG